MKRTKPKKDWVTRTAERFVGRYYVSNKLSDPSPDQVTAECRRLLRSAEKMGYKEGYEAAAAFYKLATLGRSDLFIKGMQRQKWLTECVAQSKAAERRGKRRRRR